MAYRKIRRAGSRSNGEALWLCECHCGSRRKIRTSKVREHSGCFKCVTEGKRAFFSERRRLLRLAVKIRRFIKFVGHRQGSLTVVRYSHRGRRDGIHRWLCCCDCGGMTVVKQTLLLPNSAQPAKFCSVDCPKKKEADPHYRGGISKTREYKRAVARRSNRNRNRRVRRSKSKLSHDIEFRLMRLQNGRCALCLKKFCPSESPHVDHIEPLSLGGRHEDWNVQLLCRTCNVRKWAKDPISWRQEYGFLL